MINFEEEDRPAPAWNFTFTFLNCKFYFELFCLVLKIYFIPPPHFISIFILTVSSTSHQAAGQQRTKMAPWSLIVITSLSFLSVMVCSSAAQLHEQDAFNAEVLTCLFSCLCCLFTQLQTLVSVKDQRRGWAIALQGASRNNTLHVLCTGNSQ